ncbi:MAG: alanine racemase [Candidatus Omnitrophota bacterium]
MSKHIGYRPTWAEVKLSNIDYNFAQVKKMVSSRVKVMVTVKADAYGHGLVPVAKRLCGCAADYLGVASIDEGIKLRNAGIRIPILVLGALLKNDIAPLFKYNLTATVCTQELAAAINRKAAVLHKQACVHVKVDTGMGRIGAMHREAAEIIRDIRRLKFINIEGIFTHFAFADLNEEFTLHQIKLFDRLVEDLKKEGVNIPLVHAANSAGVINYKTGHFNMVRPGIVIYGLYPSNKIKIRLKPVLSLKTKVVYAKKVPKGYGISYGHIYSTKKDTTVVTLPIGYGDGYPRNLSNYGPVLIRGRRFKISGRVCMDQVMVDVGNACVKVGDEAVLIGRQAGKRITTEELAELAGTIPYEIVCGLGSRIPRIYK